MEADVDPGPMDKAFEGRPKPKRAILKFMRLGQASGVSEVINTNTKYKCSIATAPLTTTVTSCTLHYSQ